MANFRNITKSILLYSMFTLLFAYLSFVLVNGDNGVLQYVNLKTEYEQLLQQHQAIKSYNEKIASKVEGLYAETLDYDLLDEQYRRSSGKILANEYILR